MGKDSEAVRPLRRLLLLGRPWEERALRRTPRRDPGIPNRQSIHRPRANLPEPPRALLLLLLRGGGVIRVPQIHRRRLQKPSNKAAPRSADIQPYHPPQAPYPPSQTRSQPHHSGVPITTRASLLDHLCQRGDQLKPGGKERAIYLGYLEFTVRYRSILERDRLNLRRFKKVPRPTRKTRFVFWAVRDEEADAPLGMRVLPGGVQGPLGREECSFCPAQPPLPMEYRSSDANAEIRTLRCQLQILQAREDDAQELIASMQKSRDAIRAQRLAMEDRIRALNDFLAAMHPLSNFPNEILAEIFSHVRTFTAYSSSSTVQTLERSADFYNRCRKADDRVLRLFVQRSRRLPLDIYTQSPAPRSNNPGPRKIKPLRKSLQNGMTIRIKIHGVSSEFNEYEYGEQASERRALAIYGSTAAFKCEDSEAYTISQLGVDVVYNE
ncbi:hypothetical protein H0H92_007408 [Tricholoma furcatifolium]|nr:hypothetical protein H0H92_007408 [Tricholoma furcatifolium]